MERREAVTVGDVLRECLEKSSMQGRLDELRACEAFPLVVGSHIALMCSRPYIRNGVMTIGTPNASLRSELNMSRGRIVKGINEIMGKDVVKELLFRN